MTDIEQRSLQTKSQLSLDIINNQIRINSYIEDAADKMYISFKDRRMNEDDATVSIPKKDFDELWGLIHILRDKTRWYKIDSTVKDCLDENKIKLDILNRL